MADPNYTTYLRKVGNLSRRGLLMFLPAFSRGIFGSTGGRRSYSVTCCVCREMPPLKELSTTISPTQKQPRSEVDRGHPCPRLCARTCDALVAHYACLPTSKLSAQLAENNGDRWSGIFLPETSFPIHWHTFFNFFILRIYLFLTNLNYFNCLFTALMEFLSDSMTF